MSQLPTNYTRLPQLSITQLEYLVAVADQQTWAQAAALIGVTPSALSQGLAELERRLGREIFEQKGRRRVVAPTAGPIVAYARRVLAETSDLHRWLENERLGRAGSVRLGIIDAAAIGHFPNELQGFRRSLGEADFTLTVAPSAVLLGKLVEGALDVAVLVEPDVRPVGIEWEPLLEEDLAVYAPPDTIVGSPSGWGPWVAFPASSHTTKLVRDALGSIGAPFDVVAESHQPDVICEMVKLGVGWAVLPVIQAEMSRTQLRRITPQALTSRTLVAAKRTGSVQNPLLDRLVSLLRAAGQPAVGAEPE